MLFAIINLSNNISLFLFVKFLTYNLFDISTSLKIGFVFAIGFSKITDSNVGLFSNSFHNILPVLSIIK